MKRKVTYVSERGREFNTPEDAIAYDEEIPRIIRIYEGDLKKYEAIENPNEILLNDICACKLMIENLKQKWERAKKSKELFDMKEFN
jgi:hypothetical protein